MEIGFEAKRITHNATGLGNYCRTVIETLSRYAPDNEYLLFSPDSGREELRKRLPAAPSIRFCYPQTPKHGIGKSIWRSWGVVRELPTDLTLFHGLSGELPIGLRKAGICSIVTIHDLIFLRHPSYYSKIDRTIYTLKFRKACETANRIIAISEATKRDIIHYFGISDKKIDVVYQSCDAQFKRPISEENLRAVREKYRLPDRYILTVGSIEERKNLKLLVEANRLLPEPIDLVAVGKRTPYTACVEQYAAKHRIDNHLHILSNVTFPDLPAIYRNAALFVYPSRYEGFGIPMIEAATCGVPIIGTRGSCLEESGGAGAFYVDPDNAEELATRIVEVLSDTALQKQMIEAGLHHVKQFEPKQIAADLLAVYQRAIELNG